MVIKWTPWLLSNPIVDYGMDFCWKLEVNANFWQKHSKSWLCVHGALQTAINVGWLQGQKYTHVTAVWMCMDTGTLNPGHKFLLGGPLNFKQLLSDWSEATYALLDGFWIPQLNQRCRFWTWQLRETNNHGRPTFLLEPRQKFQTGQSQWSPPFHFHRKCSWIWDLCARSLLREGTPCPRVEKKITHVCMHGRKKMLKRENIKLFQSCLGVKQKKTYNCFNLASVLIQNPLNWLIHVT